MNYEALVDFNKYTLALGAGGFVYGLEKFASADSWVFVATVIALLCLLATVILGILIFAIATKAQHNASDSRLNGQTAQNADGAKLIQGFGVAHVLTLLTGMILLGVLIFTQVLFGESMAPTCRKMPSSDIYICEQKSVASKVENIKK